MILEIFLDWQKRSHYFWLRHKISYTGNHSNRLPGEAIVLAITGRWCFTDRSWKNQDNYSRQGWYSTLEDFDGLIEARNTRASESPFHSEIESFIWTMECMSNLRQYTVTFAADCSQLVKMVSEPEEWPAFASYLEDIKILKRSFNSLKLVLIPRTQNLRADSLSHMQERNHPL